MHSTIIVYTLSMYRKLILIIIITTHLCDLPAIYLWLLTLYLFIFGKFFCNIACNIFFEFQEYPMYFLHNNHSLSYTYKIPHVINVRGESNSGLLEY